MKKITLSVILLFSLITNAQLNVNNTLYSPADLILSKLIGPGVTVSNVKYNGSAPSALITNNQLGFYTTGATPTNLGLSSGLLMTNGSATGAIGPNNAGGSTTTSNFPQDGDPDLAMIATAGIKNICILEFDFIPQGPEVKFEYVFGSEEYPEYVGSAFNDVFGFFLSGPGISGPFNGAKNIALIPNSTTPISINNVNPGLNSTYYVSNAGGTTIQYDGFTTVLTAKSEVQCGQTYHIKLALADAGDSILDSAVFLKEGSFSVPRIELGGDMVGPSKACCGEILHFSTPFDPINYPGAVHSWYFNGTLVHTSTTSNVFDFDNLTCTDGTLKVIVKPYPSQLCTFEDEIIIQYQYGPILNVAPPLTLCSDTPATATGSFDLNMQINNIVPGFNSDYEELGFFHTKQDAIANTNVIPPGTWHNFTGVDNQSVFLGVSNLILTGNFCRSAMEFKLKFVNCDDLVCSPNPSSAVFDLTTRKPIIFNGFDPTKYSISFHHDMPSAVAGTAPITPENAYILTTNPEEIYVRYWENAVPLNKQFTQFSLQANQSNLAGSDGNLTFCMTDTTVFNLFDYITGEQAGGTWTIVSGSGANLDLTAGTISSNNVATSYVLQYTVSSSLNCPTDFSLLNITINPICGVQTPPDMFLCDDSSNNGIEIFDLSSQNTIILGSLSSADYTISYHVSSADAISGALPITPNNAYPNISNPQTIYIRAVKNSDNSAFDTSKFFQLHVVAQPVVTSFTGTASICLGSSTNLVFVGTPNATITYSNGTTNQPPVLLNATTGIATVTVSPTVLTTYSLVSIASTGTPGCTNPASGSVVVTVTPNNTVTAASSAPTLCVNTALTPSITHTTTGATGIGTPTDLPPGVTASWSGNTITITGTPTTAVGSPFNYTIPLTGGCGTVDATGTITVNPENTVTVASSAPTLCVNTPLTPITHATTGATGIGAPIGLPSGVIASWLGDVITISGTPTTAVGSPFTYTIPLTGGCGSVTATGTITVNLNNTVGTASSTPTLCVNTLLTPITHATTGATGIGVSTGLPSGVTASWLGDVITISGTPTTAVGSPFAYTIPLTGGCGAFNATGTITVTPDNTVTAASSAPTLCVNTLLTPITHTTTGATGIGVPTGLPSGVTASWLGNTITISGTPTTTVGSPFTYTIPLTGGCGTVDATGTITVNPDNTVTAASSTPTLCVNTLLTPITHTTTGATGIGTVTGLPSGVTASWLGNTITISGTPTTAVGSPFNYTILLTGGCGVVNATGTITVNPDNTVTAASSTPTLCVNTLLTPITHATTGATGIGTATGLPSGVTASWSGNVITISGTPTTAVGSPFNYSIPLTGGCGAVAIGTITVTPDNTVTAASSTPTICINTALTTAITHTTTGATGIGVAIGLPTGVTASWSAGTITITGAPTTTVGSPFAYTIPLTGGCGTVNATGTITVNPDNTVTAASSTPTLCVNTLLTPITHTTTGATGIGTPSGLPAGVTASWSAGTITISGTPTTSVGSPFTYSIPLIGGCGAFNATGTITIIPSNTVTAASSTPTLCVNTVLIPITHTTTGATGIGTPTGLPAGVTASWSGNVITITGTPTTTVGSPFNYTIPLTGGCGAVNATGSITVNPTPSNISISGGTTICSGGTAFLMVTATAGTVMTWTATPGTSSSFTIGLSGSIQIPVSPAVYTTYTLTSASLNGCTIPVAAGPTTTAVVDVSLTPQFITQISDITICNGGTLNIASQLTSTVPGATFVWSASAYNVNATDAITGAVIHNGTQSNIDQIVSLIDPYTGGTVTIQVRPEIGSCAGTPQEIVITVKPIPAILPNQTTANKTIICNNEFVVITTHSNPVATVYSWQVNGASNVQVVGASNGTSTTGILNLQLALVNPLVGGTISFNFTPINGICTGVTEVNAITITVNPIPGTPIGLPVDEICSGETTNLIISSFPNIALTKLVWTVIDYSPSITGFTNGEDFAPFTISDLLVNTSDVQGYVKYSVTSKLGDCEGGTTEYTVLVNPLPKPNLLDGHICVNQNTGVTYQGYVLDTQLSNPDFTYDWYMLNTATNTYDILASANGPTHEVTQAGTYQVIVTNTATNCKAAADQAIVTTVYPATDFTYVVTEAFTDNATITVTVNPLGNGNLIYSLDGGAWQSSNVFTGVQAGSHEIMVEDTEGCTSITKSVEVIDYPKYFTPNGDGFNDNWKIVGLTAKHNAKIYIFDRYGKLIKQIDPLGDGWDGNYNGQGLPSTDYWFSVDYTENEQQKQFKAHFSLKR